VALLDRELTPRQFTRERITDPAVWALAAKVSVSYDDLMADRMREASLVRLEPSGDRVRAALDLEDADLSKFRMSFGARVRIEMAGGNHVEAEQEIPLGGAGRPLEEKRGAVEEKFRREVGRTVGAERAGAALDRIRHLETLTPDEVRELVHLVCR